MGIKVLDLLQERHQSAQYWSNQRTVPPCPPKRYVVKYSCSIGCNLDCSDPPNFSNTNVWKCTDTNITMKHTRQSVFCPCIDVQEHWYREKALKRLFLTVQVELEYFCYSNCIKFETICIDTNILNRTILDQLINILLSHQWNKVDYWCFHYIALLHPRLGSTHALRTPNPHVILQYWCARLIAPNKRTVLIIHKY